MLHHTKRHDKHPLNGRQRGAAFIVMLVIMILGVATVLVGSLSSAGIKISRDVKTAEALAQAKDALLGSAAINTDYPPGNLYCPDTDNDGTSDAGGSADCPRYIGRLPWKTLGLPDLHDAVGERMWYTLSRNVRRDVSVRPLNSDTTGTLNISGTNAGSNLMAIVFAPGTNVGTQSRSENLVPCTTTGTTIKENLCAANYLEGNNDDPSPGTAPNLNYQDANTGVPFNDQLISISHDQLLSITEKRVANEIRNVLKTYYAAWGSFPFAAPFADPSSSTFTGQASPATYEGLLPVDDQSYQPTWSFTPSISFSGSITGSMSCLLSNDVGGGNFSRWRCCDTGGGSACTGNDITIPAGVTVTVTGRLNGVGLGFWRPHNINNICEVRAKDFAGTTVLATSLFAPNSVTVTNSLNSDGSANIIFRATGKTGGTTLQRIELRNILSYNTDIILNSDTANCPPSSVSPVIPKWLFNDATVGNDWHKVAYYAVAEKFAPGGNHTCTPTPCLTVNGQNGGNNIPAAVIMTGRALTGVHPSGTLNDYLEGENRSTGDNVYENQTRSATFNDQVIVVAP